MAMNKDWKGNKRSVFVTLGSSAHSKGIRESKDYYATEPKAVEELIKVEIFNKNIWECACGEGHISKVLMKHGFNVWSTDLVDRGFGEVKDFLFFNDTKWNGDIITNPPYSLALDFVKKALEVIPEGNKTAFLLRIQFLEGKERYNFFKNNPPYRVYVASERLNCAINGDFEKYSKASASCYAWFVWIKGYKGDTTIQWINKPSL